LAIQLPLAKCHKHTYLRKSNASKYTFLQILNAANFQILESTGCFSGASAELSTSNFRVRVFAEQNLHPVWVLGHRIAMVSMTRAILKGKN